MALLPLVDMILELLAVPDADHVYVLTPATAGTVYTLPTELAQTEVGPETVGDEGLGHGQYIACQLLPAYTSTQLVVVL